jgi:NAD(P)-dependent dehydrogenase (short-subunit alcohol dehydrogenase family)
VANPRSVLITGAASGIGAAVAKRFVAAGDEVTSLDRSPSDQPQVRDVIGDVRVAADHARAVQVATQGSGRLDILIANAGVHDSGMRLTDVDAAELESRFRTVIEVDVLGYLLAARAASPALIAAQGTIVLTLSDASFDVRGNNAGIAYIAAKHAGLGLLRALARDLAPHVRVNAIAPGGVATQLVGVNTGGALKPVVDNPARLADSLAQRTLLGRGTDLDALAGWYLHLCGPDASAVTGQVIRVDGGLLP